MQDALIVKNVEQQLLNERKRRRKPGEVPYPLNYSSSMVNFDNWDNMFLVSCSQSLTMHNFTKPPAVVLDLGCGGGYWAIEAAKKWKESTIIGFDLKKIQPNPSVLGPLSNVRWVHGNLLDGLPFPSDHFDFVRIVGIGLGVPEDEWHYVLEEVARVMKPGAVVEMIEEDLIFPCGQRPLARNLTPTLNDDLRSPSSPTSSLTLSSDWQVRSFSEKWTRETSNGSGFYPWPAYGSSTTTFTMSNVSLSPAYDPDDHPQDHTALKSAWDAMLAKRFLTAQLVAVLPFYLSSFFVDVRTHPAIQIPLPPNSRSHGGRDTLNNNETGKDCIDLDIFSHIKSSRTNTSSEVNDDIGSTLFFRRKVPLHASMHLAKTVQTVTECKESIWAEYEKLYCSTVHGPWVARSSRGGEPQLLALHPSAREDFERAWSNWQNDMMDRIGMRERMASGYLWKEPSGEQPDWRTWRQSLDTKWNKERSLPTGTTGLCRSLRAFVGWKPSG